MKYQFPHIRRIEDVLPHIEGRKEFIIAEKDGYTVINYVMQTPETFAAGEPGWEVRRECRGITFDANGNIAVRKFHKFFNVGEKEETFLQNIDIDANHISLHKLDGSMITPFLNGENVEWHTKMGATDVAAPVEDFVRKYSSKHTDSMLQEEAEKQPWYQDFAYDMMKAGITPIFEWCSLKQRIVIAYPEDRLVLTAARKTVEGDYYLYDQLCDLAAPYRIPVVEAHDASLGPEFIEHVRGLVGLEGFVIRFNNGHMVKLKAEDYLLLHRVKESMAQEKNVWLLVLNQAIDDQKSMMQPDDLARVEEFERQFWPKVHTHVQNIATDFYAIMAAIKDFDYSVFDDADRERKKRFAIRNTGTFRSLLFKAYDMTDNARDFHAMFVDWMISNLSTGSKLENMRPLFDGLKFEEVKVDD